MRILVHDYGGYPFSTDLAKHLAERDHEVLHVHCASLTTTARGGARTGPSDDAEFLGLDIGRPIRRGSFVVRWLDELAYAQQLKSVAVRFGPDVVLSANAPLDVQRVLFQEMRKRRVGMVYWLQDLLGLAMEQELSDRLPLVGALIGKYYAALERKLLRRSDAVVPISEHFVERLVTWGIQGDKITVIPNWAPLADTPVRERDNPWARAQKLGPGPRFIYTGNLGMKHDPEALVNLAEHLSSRGDGEVIVVSQGVGADWLKAQIESRRLDNLRVLPFQPSKIMPDVLGAADVLVALLTDAAGAYSVPSKILAYLCAARPILLSAPSDNPAAGMVRGANAGIVVSNRSALSLPEAVDKMSISSVAVREMGERGRLLAEQRFNSRTIVEQFERVLKKAKL